MDALLAEYGETASVTPTGGISWPGFGFERMETALRSALVVIEPTGEEFGESEARAVIWDALKESVRRSGGKAPISAADFLRAADGAAAAFLRKPSPDYVLVSSLSIDRLPVKTMRVGDCRLERMPLRRAASYEIPPSLEDDRDRRGGSPPLFASMRVRTHGRTFDGAAERALNALNLVRAVWSLFDTYGSRSISLVRPARQPLGVVHAGRYHTLHHSSGKSVGDIYWYEPDFSPETRKFRPRSGWTELERHGRWAFSRLRVSPYANELRDLLLRYISALDQVNLDLAFLQMWSLLEKITGTVGGRYDDTIRRATWTWDKPALPSAFLEAMRTHRNRLVHASSSTEQGDQVTQMVKEFVDGHFARLLRNDFDVQSLNEYSEQLSQPRDLDALRKSRRHTRRAIRFHS